MNLSLTITQISLQKILNVSKLKYECRVKQQKADNALPRYLCLLLPPIQSHHSNTFLMYILVQE